MAAPRIATISVACASILLLAACGTQGAGLAHRIAELDKIDAMTCPDLAAYRAELEAAIPEAEVADLAKNVGLGAGFMAATIATGGLAALAAPLVGAADVNFAARARQDYIEVRRLEMHRCPRSNLVKAAAINPAR